MGCSESLLDTTVDYLMLQSSFLPSLGLYNGKIGSVLFFYIYGDWINCDLYGDFAFELLNEVVTEMYDNLPVNYAYGISGIGWAINYLSYKKYIDTEDAFLSDIDKLVMKYDPRRITDTSLETGLTGLVCYVKSRLAVRKNPLYQPFDACYLNDFYKACEKYDLGISNEEEYAFSTVLRKVLEYNVKQKGIITWRTGLSMIL